MNTDQWRPYHDPARSIYDSFQVEAAHRAKRTVEEWLEKEPQAVWRAARDYAQQHGLGVPTIDQVKAAETCAAGHVDYAAKWAYGVARLLTQPTKEGGARG